MKRLGKKLATFLLSSVSFFLLFVLKISSSRKISTVLRRIYVDQIYSQMLLLIDGSVISLRSNFMKRTGRTKRYLVTKYFHSVFTAFRHPAFVEWLASFATGVVSPPRNGSGDFPGLPFFQGHVQPVAQS